MNNRTTRWLITGARGFVGRHLIDLLLADSDVDGIWTIDRDSTPLSPDHRPGVIPTNTKLEDVESIRACISEIQPTYVVHLAAQSSVAKSWAEPVDCFHNNTTLFLNLVEAIRLARGKCRVLSVGSSEQYGPHADADLPLHEGLIQRPTNPYAVARVAQEMLSHVYATSYGVDIVCTRSFNHVGPDQSPTFVVSSLCKQVIEMKHGIRDHITTGNLDIVRDFIDVRDVVRGYALLLKTGITGEVYNVCSGHGIRLRDLVDTICELANARRRIAVDPARVRPTDSPTIIGDNARLRKLGFLPQIPLRQAINAQLATWERDVGSKSRSLKSRSQ